MCTIGNATAKVQQTWRWSIFLTCIFVEQNKKLSQCSSWHFSKLSNNVILVVILPSRTAKENPLLGMDLMVINSKHHFYCVQSVTQNLFIPNALYVDQTCVNFFLGGNGNADCISIHFQTLSWLCPKLHTCTHTHPVSHFLHGILIKGQRQNTKCSLDWTKEVHRPHPSTFQFS